MSEDLNRELAAKILANELAKSFIQEQRAADDEAEDVIINGEWSESHPGGIWDLVKDLEPIEDEVRRCETVEMPSRIEKLTSDIDRAIYLSMVEKIERTILEDDK